MFRRTLLDRSVRAALQFRTLPLLGLAALALGAGCASSPAADDVEVAALASSDAETTLLVSKEPEPHPLTLEFGLDQERRPIVVASRGSKKRVLGCTSTVEVSNKPDWVWIECSHEVAEGESCYTQLERTAANEFTVNVGCGSERNGQPVPLAPTLAATYEILTGEPAPSGTYDAADRDRYGVVLREARRGADPFVDTIAYAEALAPAMKSLLGRAATIKSFDGSIRDVPVERVIAHTQQAKRLTQLVAFASAYTIEVKELSVEGAPGKFVTGADVLGRTKSHGLCSEGPPGVPHCLK